MLTCTCFNSTINHRKQPNVVTEAGCTKLTVTFHDVLLVAMHWPRFFNPAFRVRRPHRDLTLFLPLYSVASEVKLAELGQATWLQVCGVRVGESDADDQR